MSINKSLEEYRQLAEKCRETARMLSWDNERSRLLESRGKGSSRNVRHKHHRWQRFSA